MQTPRFRLGSLGLVALILGALTVWMLSGLFSQDAGSETAGPATQAAVPAFTVQVRQQSAENVQRLVLANGDTHPDQVVNIASQVEGQVMEVGPRKGARVNENDVLLRIDARDLDAVRSELAAMVRTRELEHAAAQKLRETGYVTEGELAAKMAALEAARADLIGVELRMLGLRIVAPVSGVLEDRMVEKGDYVKVGEPVARLLKLDPLIVSVPVSEADIPWVKVGAPAEAEVLGRKLPGRVRFVASLAEASTRTFTVEVAVANPAGLIPAGTSARVTLPVEAVRAQRIQTSLLSLADDGGIGIKHVVDGKVVFTPASVVRSDGDAVYVAGLPDPVALITRGQGFVAAGQPVQVELEKAAVAAGAP